MKNLQKKNKSSLSVSLMHDFSFWTFQNGVAKKAGWQINIMEEIEGRVYYVSGIYLWSDNIGLKYTNKYACSCVFRSHIFFLYNINKVVNHEQIVLTTRMYKLNLILAYMNKLSPHKTIKLLQNERTESTATSFMFCFYNKLLFKIYIKQTHVIQF